MTTMIINGREVKTNYAPYKSYSFCDGNDRKGWTMRTAKFGETPEEMVHRLGEYYSRVSIYMVTTRVKGYYEYIAYCKR